MHTNDTCEFCGEMIQGEVRIVGTVPMHVECEEQFNEEMDKMEENEGFPD